MHAAALRRPRTVSIRVESILRIAAWLLLAALAIHIVTSTASYARQADARALAILQEQ